jgi:hypothetical protein
MLEKDFNGKAKITAGEALSGVETGPLGGLGNQDIDPLVKEKRCPQGLVSEIEKTAGYANYRGISRRLPPGSPISGEVVPVVWMQ